MGLLDSLLRWLTGTRMPVGPAEKAWIERRFLWLREEFGTDPLRTPTLVPGSAVLPRRWSGTRGECEDLVGRLCLFMGTDRSKLELEFLADEAGGMKALGTLLPAYEMEHSGPAGLYQRSEVPGQFVLTIAEAGLGDPVGLVATICHELGHVHLLGNERMSPDEADQEPLTDLLTVYFGAGLFTANSAFRFRQWHDFQKEGWSARRLGYLSEPLLGYALAGYAWMRGETRPEWQREIATNIGPYFADALYLLERNRETTLPFAAVREIDPSADGP
ncbi:MAG: hypothetical protein L0216_05925 [Planctomycetales bacterium]|nr:hypothetical protein [Planctomycetales bacterium]